MTATQTLREPKAKRLIDVPASPTLAETDKPKTPMEWYEYDCRKFIEDQKHDGVPDDEIITIPEIVAICKEARAERYAEEQKNATCR
jgi:hypothetical protein